MAKPQLIASTLPKHSIIINDVKYLNTGEKFLFSIIVLSTAGLYGAMFAALWGAGG